MESINIHQVKTHLSSLVDKVSRSGEAFIIAKAGKPVAKVVPIDAPGENEEKRLGFLEGRATIPDNFDSIGDSQIQKDFLE
jgi:prevent-host-death family protein